MGHGRVFGVVSVPDVRELAAGSRPRLAAQQEGGPMTAVAGPPAAAVTDPGRPRRRPGREIFRTAGSVALAAAIFGFAVPHFASYRSAWASMHAMTWAQTLLIAAVAIVSMIST